MTIDNIQLKITGGMDMETEPTTGHDLIIQLPVSIYSKETKDNQDGTFNVVYKAKACGAIEARQGDQRIQGKDKTKDSKKTRDFLYWQGESYNVVDHESFYSDVLQLFRADTKFIDGIISKLDMEKYK